MTKSTLIASVAAGALVLVSPVLAQQASLSGPTLGFVFSEPEQQLRTLRGVLGSATIGDPVDLGVPITQALTLDLNHVVASSESNSELQIVNLETRPASVNAISGVRARPSRAIASVHGTAAAFYYADSQQAVIVTGLPRNPVVAHSVDLSSSGTPTSIAVSDDGGLLVYSVAAGTRADVYSWTDSSTSSRFISSAASVGGIAITAGGGAIVTDHETNEVLAVWDARSGSSPQYLASNADGISSPADVAVSTSDRIYVANTGSGTITTLDSSGHILRTLGCNCKVSGLYPLRDSVFRLTTALDQTVYLLDASPARDRILFVPPLVTDK